VNATPFEGLSLTAVLPVFGVVVAAYAIGSIPWAYIIVRLVTGEDVTEHGSGNVGAMNVRRTTGSWAWFAAAMVADFTKGVLPVAVTKWLALGTVLTPLGIIARTDSGVTASQLLMPMAAVAGAVLGHNYSVWMAVIKGRFGRTGKGLSTGAGALLAYDWRYFLAVVVVGLTTIAITRYMMAGQVAAAFTLPIAALVLNSPDWPFALAMGLVVYAAHHKRFVGMLHGKEPRLYVNDRMGPRG
jgi:glycerol-3-phosphate acyltransferase PlsY